MEKPVVSLEHTHVHSTGQARISGGRELTFFWAHGHSERAAGIGLSNFDQLTEHWSAIFNDRAARDGDALANRFAVAASVDGEVGIERVDALVPLKSVR